VDSGAGENENKARKKMDKKEGTLRRKKLSFIQRRLRRKFRTSLTSPGIPGFPGWKSQIKRFLEIQKCSDMPSPE